MPNPCWWSGKAVRIKLKINTDIMKREQSKKKLCLALDVDQLSKATDMARRLKDYVGIFKIGLQLFTKEGPKTVETIRDLGGNVFLDLKFHDIPNTVGHAVRMATKTGAYMINIHAAGGSEMMRAAVEAAEEESEKSNIPKPVILAVTVLTSTNNIILSKELRVNYEIESQVIHFAKLAQSVNVSGVVASPKEISAIRNTCGNDFIILTPGIRPAWSTAMDDQKRVTTPGEAIRLGADYIVVGRPILNADDPIKAAEKILNEMESEVS